MRYKGSVYSAYRHDDGDLAESSASDTDDEETGLLLGRLPSLNEEEDEDDAQKPGKRGQQKRQYQKQLSEEQSADPHAAGLGGSLSSATLGIIKAMVGPAILYLPHGFAGAGYLVAIPVLVLSTTLYLWSSACLLQCWKAESDRLNQRRLSMNNNHSHGLKLRKRIVLSYPELAYRAFGIKGEKLVQIGISLMQSGVCLTYLIFVPQNLRTSALLLFDCDISTTWTLLLMMAVQIPLSWIRDIRRLTVTNLLANILIMYGLVTCLGFAVREMGSGQEVLLRAQNLTAFNPSGWFLFLGTSVLLFEGSITLLVPLQEAVHSPLDREKFPCLYRRVILGIVSFYSFFGIMCWLAFGDNVRTVMTTSLPSSTLATSVQLAYSLAVVFTFPLQNFPSLEITCVAVQRIFAGNGKVGLGHSNDQRSVISTLLVVVLSIIALFSMEALDRVVSLMGSVLGCPLAFVLPPLIQNQLGKGEIGETKRRLNSMVAVLGVCAMMISTATTLVRWE